ncbi:MAG: 50S ribosomal protein L15 [Caulobacteraceae bacterium]
MTKLNELSPSPGSTKNRMRVGRGPGSGKGKTAGRGVKGQKARSGVAIAGFEGGQMPLHMRMPKRGFNNPFAKQFAEVNFWRLEQAIAAGKLDAKKPIDGAALVAAGILRRVNDGVKLLGKGDLVAKLDITVYAASASARAAVEKAGGKLTETRPQPVAAAETPAAEAPAAETPAAKSPPAKSPAAKTGKKK